MRTDFSNSRLPGQRFPVENIAQYRKTEAKPLRQVVYLISGINPTLSKPSHGFPLVCKALRKRNRQFRGGNQKKENSSAKFRWPGLLFFNYTQKIFSFYFVLLSCLTKALHEQHGVAISGKCLRRGTFRSLLTKLSAVSSKGSPRMHAGKSS